jgi:hypothetical protein
VKADGSDLPVFAAAFGGWFEGKVPGSFQMS